LLLCTAHALHLTPTPHRLVGVFDALILGDIFSCFRHYRSVSASSANDIATDATSASAGTHAVHASAGRTGLFEMVEVQVSGGLCIQAIPC